MRPTLNQRVFAWLLSGCGDEERTLRSSRQKTVLQKLQGSWVWGVTVALLASAGPAGAGLVGLWQLNEGLGQIIHDSSGNGLDGYLGNSSATTTYDPTWSTSGSTLGAGGGSALYFPAGVSNTRAQVNDTPLLTPSSALTLAIDFKPAWLSQGVWHASMAGASMARTCSTSRLRTAITTS